MNLTGDLTGAETAQTTETAENQIEQLGNEILKSSNDEITNRIKLLDNEIKVNNYFKFIN